MECQEYETLYRAGRFQDAAEACARLLSGDPGAAHANLFMGMALLRLEKAREAIRHLKAIGGAIPPNELLTALRSGLGGGALNLQAAMAAGGFLRSAFGRLRQPSATPVSHDYINVLGSSHARSFGTHPIFFPVFIAIGRTCLVLTEEHFEKTRRKYLDNLARLDRSRDIIVILGGEPRLHLENFAGTRPTDGPDVTDEDRALMGVCAGRYGEILREIKDRVDGRVILYNVLPTFDLRVNELTRVMNDALRRVCGELGVLFLDVCDEITDPASGLLRDDIAAVAFKGDFHLNDSALPIVIAGLHDLGVFPDDTDDDCGFRWSYVFGYSVSPGEESRIWCEPDVSPTNALTSDKVACALLANTALDFLSINLLGLRDPRVLMVNVKEGYLALNAPAELMGCCVAVADSDAHARMAQRIAHFAGRADIEFVAHGAPEMDRLGDEPFDMVVVHVHPDTIGEDCRRAREVLDRVDGGTLYVLTPQPDAVTSLGPAASGVDSGIAIGNRHIPEKWREFSIRFGAMAAARAVQEMA